MELFRSEILHSPRDVRRRIQEVLFRALAVQPDRNEVAFVLFHHELEIGVRHEVFVRQSHVL